jgi:hypothetical protein
VDELKGHREQEKEEKNKGSQSVVFTSIAIVNLRFAI